MSEIENLKRKNKVLEQAVNAEIAERLRLEEEKEKLLRRSRVGQGIMESPIRLTDEEKGRVAEMKIRETPLSEIIREVYEAQNVNIDDREIWDAITHDEPLPLRRQKL